MATRLERDIAAIEVAIAEKIEPASGSTDPAVAWIVRQPNPFALLAAMSRQLDAMQDAAEEGTEATWGLYPKLGAALAEVRAGRQPTVTAEELITEAVRPAYPMLASTLDALHAGRQPTMTDADVLAELDGRRAAAPAHLDLGAVLE